MAKQIGTVTHYYDRIGVAIVDLTGSLKVGDTIQISGSTEFTQSVDSLQREHLQLDQAEKGDTVGLKVNQPVKPKDKGSLV